MLNSHKPASQNTCCRRRLRGGSGVGDGGVGFHVRGVHLRSPHTAFGSSTQHIRSRKEEAGGILRVASSRSSSSRRWRKRPGPHVRGTGRVPGPEGDARSLARLRRAAALLAGASGPLVEPAQQRKHNKDSDFGFERSGRKIKYEYCRDGCLLC